MLTLGISNLMFGDSCKIGAEKAGDIKLLNMGLVIDDCVVNIT